ncbi:MAG: thiamine pyrophosphate-dependent dehydrogenase E1 component subunit alpha [Clostridia bacterium]|nr:thiamine pyrophosphate-dependent dehydrogenase E1 component subunit alpha [Clostridia bacterium]
MKIPENFSKELLESLYRTMEEIRQFELKTVELYTTGELPGFLHSCLGEEAAAVGVVATLREDDYIVTNHRGHGHVIAKGTHLNNMMAELYAKQDGCCKGKGGSMHIIDRSKNILGANGIVGQGTTLATGAALASQIRGTDQVSVCFFGDGAQNEGFFHESINMASIWKLPIIFACENNMYAESTPQTYHMNIKDIAGRAAAYGVEGVIADGNDVIDVYLKTKEAVEKCRRGEGPVLLESKTYRWLGHYVGDPGVYRSKEEVELWKSDEKEPIAMFRRALIKAKRFTEAELDQIRGEVAERIEQSVAFGRNSEPLPAESALEHVFKEGLI